MELTKETQTQETQTQETHTTIDLHDQISNLITENNNLKKRLDALENLCKTFTQQIYKLEETITEIEDDFYDDEDDEDD